MSFAANLKDELCKDVPEQESALHALLYGFLLFSHKFTADETFASVYIKFGGKHTYTYDPIMEREATWVFYQTSENEGFISFYAELDVNDGNPDPIVCPEISYNPDSNTVYMVLNAYGSFMITIELTR